MSDGGLGQKSHLLGLKGRTLCGVRIGTPSFSLRGPCIYPFNVTVDISEVACKRCRRLNSKPKEEKNES